MEIGRRALLGGAVGLLAAGGAAAQGWGDPPSPYSGDAAASLWPPRERLPLWPGKPPGAPSKAIVPNWTMNGPAGSRELWIRGVPFPELHVVRPARPDGSALLSLPGGGYQFLSVQNEGLDVAQHFNATHTTVFVLTYRLPGEGWSDRHLVALQDVQRAMRLIRANADAFDIDPARLGVVGFSAGGHLAADLAVAHADPVYKPVDAADRLSAKPAYVGLVYAVTDLSGPISRSLGNLLGENPPEERIAARSPVKRVTRETPPSFLVHSLDDPVVNRSNSLDWMAAVSAQGVPVEAHFFTSGGHGYGLHLAEDQPGSRWPELFDLWLRRHGG
jgi:acetyl esterase/lipase